ncbi:MAG: hypothetical protein GEU73_03955 [Chloroflexi bacterium]|nr:hypothetical protein [Chloroflexota bacterium]
MLVLGLVAGTVSAQTLLDSSACQRSSTSSTGGVDVGGRVGDLAVGLNTDLSSCVDSALSADPSASNVDVRADRDTSQRISTGATASFSVLASVLGIDVQAEVGSDTGGSVGLEPDGSMEGNGSAAVDIGETAGMNASADGSDSVDRSAFSEFSGLAGASTTAGISANVSPEARKQTDRSITIGDSVSMYTGESIDTAVSGEVAGGTSISANGGSGGGNADGSVSVDAGAVVDGPAGGVGLGENGAFILPSGR